MAQASQDPRPGQMIFDALAKKNDRLYWGGVAMAIVGGLALLFPFGATLAIAIMAGWLLILFGVDPLKLTLFTMAISAFVLPFVAIPFLLIMNDRKRLKEHANGWISNSVAAFLLVGGLRRMGAHIDNTDACILGGGGEACRRMREADYYWIAYAVVAAAAGDFLWRR